MKRYPLALFDAFTDVAFGGSQAAVITAAATISDEQRRQIAREIGMPATAFVDDYGKDWVQAQFMSTVMELPMCGHGTLCLFTQLLESGVLQADRDVELRLPRANASVSLGTTAAGRYRVMLEIQPPRFVAAPADIDELPALLGLGTEALSPALPMEIARGDFIHLVVPLSGLAAMRKITPDFSAMIRFCHRHGIETIAVFCLETENPEMHLHVRDFCPAVGVSESAAAGTTNAALSGYLLRHALVATDRAAVTINAEQGLELGRPSSIQSLLELDGNGEIRRLQVGGVATRVFQGEINL
jgi:trans-2,3-dihydro-3-hydroxyanthranilate isomerase